MAIQLSTPASCDPGSADSVEHCRSPIATNTGVPLGMRCHTVAVWPITVPGSTTDGSKLTGNSAAVSLQNTGTYLNHCIQRRASIC